MPKFDKALRPLLILWQDDVATDFFQDIELKVWLSCKSPGPPSFPTRPVSIFKAFERVRDQDLLCKKPALRLFITQCASKNFKLGIRGLADAVPPHLVQQLLIIRFHSVRLLGEAGVRRRIPPARSYFFQRNQHRSTSIEGGGLRLAWKLLPGQQSDQSETKSVPKVGESNGSTNPPHPD